MRTVEDKVWTIKPTTEVRSDGIYAEDHHGVPQKMGRNWDEAWEFIRKEAMQDRHVTQAREQLLLIHQKAEKAKNFTGEALVGVMNDIQTISLQAVLAIYPDYIDTMDAEEK